MAVTPEVRGFPSPFAVEAPPGAEDWRRLYPYYYLFSEPRREFEEGKFWFFEGMHNPEPVYPFDTIMTESWWVALNMFGTRVYVIPPALGIDQRIVNGYLYISPNSITDPDLIASRAELFTQRAGHYYENWDGSTSSGSQGRGLHRAAQGHRAPRPARESSRRGRRVAPRADSSFDLLATYNRLIENMQEMAYLPLRDARTRVRRLPHLPRLLPAGLPRDRRPDDLEDGGRDRHPVLPPRRRGAQARALALELGLADGSCASDDPEAALAAIAEADGGDRGWPRSRRPRTRGSGSPPAPATRTSTAPGSTTCGCPSAPCAATSTSSGRARTIERPLEAIKAESERVFAEYRALLGPDDAEAFTPCVELAKTVYPFVENHNFYVEHWHHSIFWNRVREIGQILVDGGFLEDREDVFYLHRFELHDALYDLCTGWATGTPARGPSYWPPEVAERKRIMRQAPGLGPAAGPGHPAAGGHRAVHGDAVRRHHRHRQHVAGPGRRRGRRPARHRRDRPASPRASRA